MELKEKEVLDLIKSGEKFLLKVMLPDCPACNDFKPIWDKVASELPETKFVDFLLLNVSTEGAAFKKDYMKPSFQGEKVGAPAVFLFEDGKAKFRQFSGVTEVELKTIATITTAQRIENAKADLQRMFLRKGQLSFYNEQFIKEMPQIDSSIKEIQKFLESPQD